MFGRWKKRAPEPAQPYEDDEAPDAYAIKSQAEVGMVFARNANEPDEDREQQLAYARRAIVRCLDQLALLEDEFYHGFAAHQVILLCLTAGEELTARALYAGVKDPFLREKILADAPDLMTRPLA